MAAAKPMPAEGSSLVRSVKGWCVLAQCRELRQDLERPQLTPPTADIRQQPLQFGNPWRGEGQLQFGPAGVIALVFQQAVEFCKPRLEQRQFGKQAMAAILLAGHQLDARYALQAFIGAAAVGASEAAVAELDATVEADHQHRHLVHLLAPRGCEDRPARRAAGFAVITETVLLADFPGPAVMTGAGVAVRGDKRLRLGRAANRRGEGDKAAFANFLAVLARADQGEGHQASLDGGVRPQPLRMMAISWSAASS